MKSYTKGYILLDALIGVALLSLVMVSCLFLYSQSINRMSDVRAETKAVFLAQAKMEELKVEETLAEEDNGDFGEDYKGYTWTSISTVLDKANFYHLVQLKVAVHWMSRGNDRQFTLETKFMQKKS